MSRNVSIVLGVVVGAIVLLSCFCFLCIAFIWLVPVPETSQTPVAELSTTTESSSPPTASATPIPPTASATPTSPTSTPTKTPTSTPIPPTNTPTSPTNTPTITLTPTETPIPPTPTPTRTPTSTPTSTVTSTPTNTPTATNTPIPEIQSGGLGLSKERWELSHTETDLDYTPLGTGYDNVYDVLFRQNKVWIIYRYWDSDDGQTVSYIEELSQSLIPTDSEFLYTYTPDGRPETTVMVFFSESLAQAFEDDGMFSVWGDEEPGTFIVHYNRYEGVEGIAGLVISVGNNP